MPLISHLLNINFSVDKCAFHAQRGWDFMCFYCIKRDAIWFNYISFTSHLYTLYTPLLIFPAIIFLWLGWHQNKPNCPENNATYVRHSENRTLEISNLEFDEFPFANGIRSKAMAKQTIFFPLLSFVSVCFQVIHSIIKMCSICLNFQYMIYDQFRASARFRHSLISSIYIFHMVLSDSTSSSKRRRNQRI